MPPKKIELPLFYPGRKIEVNGKIYTVDHVRVCGHDLKIKFKELSEDVDSKNIPCESTVFVL